MIDEIKVIMNCPITRRYIYGIFIQQFHPLIALKYILKIIILIIKCKIYQKENFIEIFKKITGESYLAIIKKNTKKNMVAFFYPEVTMRDHFDEIQNNLENLGIKTINLYGTIKNDLLENKANSFYVGAPSDFFSLKRLDFINFFVTASVVDCFPPNSTKILIDHLSYATFRPVSMDSINDRMNHDFLMKKYEYFFKLIVIYDHIFLPNILRKNLTIQMLSLHGYSKKNQRINEKNKISFFLDKYLINDGQKIRQKIFLHELGYPKLDKDFSKYKTQKKIIYAPTHLDDMNKNSWKEYVSSNTHGEHIVEQLCVKFPDYKIIYKPYINDDKKIIEKICKRNNKYKNFIFDIKTRNEDLYKEAPILISDFSSTAFTYAITTHRPVVFFSKNENLLKGNSSDYLRERSKFGYIVENTDELIKIVSNLLFKKHKMKKNILNVIKKNQYNYMKANNKISAAIFDIVNNKKPGHIVEEYESQWLSEKNNN